MSNIRLSLRTDVPTFKPIRLLIIQANLNRKVKVEKCISWPCQDHTISSTGILHHTISILNRILYIFGDFCPPDLTLRHNGHILSKQVVSKLKMLLIFDINDKAQTKTTNFVKMQNRHNMEIKDQTGERMINLRHYSLAAKYASA